MQRAEIRVTMSLDVDYFSLFAEPMAQIFIIMRDRSLDESHIHHDITAIRLLRRVVFGDQYCIILHP